MLNPWLILASLAFAVSFGVSLLMAQAMGGALIAGSMAALTALVTTGAVNWYRNHGMDARAIALKQQIRLLQRQRANEHQAMLEMSAERERVAQALNSMQTQLRQYQLPDAVPQSQKVLSWNLSTSASEAAIATPHPSAPSAYEAAEDDLNQFLIEAAATKQKIIASLNHLQAELSQLNTQITDHRQVRDHLGQEIKSLMQQKQQLTASTQQLQAELEELERCRVELDQYISYVEAKKQELEAGSNPLQQALKKLQEQVTDLQEELRQLESQVTTRRQDKETLEQQIKDRRQEKESLEKQIAQLQAQKSSLRHQVNQAEAAGSDSQRSSKSATHSQETSAGNGKSAASAKTANSALQRPSGSNTDENPADALPDRWTEFMVQLSDYELQILRAIALESNPLRILNRIAEDNFTTVDELVESINERSQEIIGDRVIKSRSGFGPPTLFREHQKTIKKLIETYE
jgi:chromosome segregation ATPase